MLEKVRKTIDTYNMLSPGDRVLVAVSGGPDSVCLLSALHVLSKELDITLHIAHLDHMFRGEESAEEARFVSALAQRLGIPAMVEQIDVPAFCRERGLSSQEGAREVRYEFLRRVAAKLNCTRIATGHTADDQAETFLMRLLRGAGVSGLAAIPPKRDAIIRPLIMVTREEVVKYLRSNNLDYRTDPSNATPVYTRNRVRLEVMPILKHFNPRIVETLASEAALLREENEAVEAYLETVAESACAPAEGALSIRRDVFDTLPPAFRRRLLRRVVDQAGKDASRLSRGSIDDALQFMMSSQTGKSLALSDAVTITREYNRFILSPHEVPEAFSQTLALPGITPIPQLGLAVETGISEREDAGTEDANYLWRADFDYDKIMPILTVRNRRPGDWFQPAGMGGKSKKLQNYYVDEKVPRRKRDAVPLLCSGEDILWVMGLRTDERFLASAGTRRMVTVTVRSLGPETLDNTPIA
ncbi:MAG TPA: tRNA lysidine(34) synthetase TilS [Nitrospirota bacterium]